MADKSEEPRESNAEWETQNNSSSEQHDPKMADESKEPRESNSEWETLYNRSTEQHDPNELATDERHTQIDGKSDGCITTSTKCMGTQTDFDLLSEENLSIVAEEMTRALFESFHSKYFSEGLSGLETRYQAQLIDNAEMVSNGPDPFGTPPAVNANVMTGLIPRTKNNQDAAVAVKTASDIPRKTNSRYAQTEPCNLYDTSEESLKETGRHMAGRMLRFLTNPKDFDLNQNISGNGFLEMLSNGSLGDIFGAPRTLISKSKRPGEGPLNGLWKTLIELMNTQVGSDSVEKQCSSSQVDTETTNATDGRSTQPEILETLKTVAEEIAQALDLNTDADDEVALMNIRHFPGFDQHNETLITLMGISREDSSVMEINVGQNQGCGAHEHNDTELSTTSTLSKLLRGHLDKKKLRDDNKNDKKVSEKSFSQPTLEEYQKYESVSLATSVAMARIGYGHDIRKQRIEWYRKFGRRFDSILCGIFPIMIVGSKAEGLTRFFESDIDFIFLMNHVICLENDKDTNGIDINKTVLIIKTDDPCPGYCKLILRRYDSSFVSGLSRALVKDEAGRLFLSSEGFLKVYGGWFLGLPNMMSGPSLPILFQNLHFDRVVALPCHCPNILNRWASRPRNWPPPDVVQKVVSFEAFLAPVGFKESNSKQLEWRYCFNKAETELIISLNDTQSKLYVLLKMVVKDVLKPRRKEITSYTVKNIVLWLAEKNQQTLFHDRSLLHWLHKCLEELRTAIATKNLAYYMIPERNLMATCGLENEQQCVWVDTLTAMMDEGPMVIKRFQKIRQAIISYPGPLFWYSQVRTELEMLLFEMINCIAQFIAQVLELRPYTDSTLGEIWSRVWEIIQEVHKRLNKEGIWFYDIWDLMVRMMS